MKTVLMVSLCLLLGIGIQAQTAPEKEDSVAKVTKISLAKKDSEGNIIEDLETFDVKDIPIYCYIDLNADKPTLVKMDFIAVKAKGLRPNTKLVSTSYKTKQGETGVTFNASPNKIWAVGDYLVNIYLDGKISESKEFKIENSK